MSEFGVVQVGDFANFKDKSGDRPVLLSHKQPIKVEVTDAELEFTKKAQKLRATGDTTSEAANDANVVIRGTTVDELANDDADNSGYDVTLRYMYTGEFPARGNEPPARRADVLLRLMHATGDITADDVRDMADDGVDPNGVVDFLQGKVLTMYAKEGRPWKGNYSSDFTPLRPLEYESSLKLNARAPLSSEAQKQWNRENGITTTDTAGPQADVEIDDF